MPQEYDSPDSPFIRISRNGESARTYSRNAFEQDDERELQAEASRRRSSDRGGRRSLLEEGDDYANPFREEEASFGAPRRSQDAPGDARTRRARGARPMPKRLSEEQFDREIEREYEEPAAFEEEEEIEVVPPVKKKPAKRTTGKSKRAKAETVEQLPLDLKAPKKKTDNTVKQRQVLALSFITAAILVTIAIVSYTPNDAAQAETKFSDIPAIFTRSNPQVNANADTVHNWLGLLGAMLADFLINKTIGYAAIIYPVFFGWWSLALFKFTTKQRRRLTLATSFFLVTAILFSATIGVTQLIPSLPHLAREWSGAVGQFLGITFTRLIGSVGALIVYATLFIITLVFSIDLDIERTFLRLKGYQESLVTTMRRKWVEYQEQRAEKSEAKRLAQLEEEEEERDEEEGEANEGIELKKTAAIEDAVEEVEEVRPKLKKQEATPEKSAKQKVTEATKPAVLKAETESAAIANDIDPAKDILGVAGSASTVASNAATPAIAAGATAEDPVKIVRSAAPVAAGLAEGAIAATGVKAAGVAQTATAAGLPLKPAASAPVQPQLKVRPIGKNDAAIPRMTRSNADKLGEKQNSFAKLTNGAIDPKKPAASDALDALSKQERPVANQELPELPAQDATATDVFGTAASALNDTQRDSVILDRANGEQSIAEQPLAKNSFETAEDVQTPSSPAAPVKKEQKIEVRHTSAPVIVGDERTISDEALPHSVSIDEGLQDVVREHQAMSRQVTRSGERGELFDVEPKAPKVIVPENPYSEVLSKFKNPSLNILTPADPKDELDADDEELAMKGRLLRDKLATFGVEIENITVTPGPVVTLYEFTPAEGVKVSRVESLTDDIALAMKARGIRIIAPIPGRGTIGVEIPNDIPKMVRIRSLFESASFKNTKMNLPLALGKTISGDVYIDDLNKMPHLLIAGATGAGKSVGVNGIIASLLYAKSPRDVKFVIVDPKKIELSLYKKLRKHYLIVSPEAGEDIVTTPQFAVLALKAVELEMEKRYDKLAKAAVRSLHDYNQKVAQGKLVSTQDEQHYHLPYIVVIIDELADLMITAGRDIEEPICRIAQMARAVGIHLILATQRPSVDVITGVIKANFPARIAFQVATRVDSRTILDTMGAEQLLGNGDMLYQPSGTPKPIRLQSPFITTEEVEAMIDAVAEQDGPGMSYTRPWTLPSLKQKGGGGMSSNDDDSRDDLFEDAAKIIVRHQQGSVSLLQRRLKVGYSRAARIVDELEQAGIVGPFDGSKARQVLCENEEELELVLEGLR